MDWRLKAGLQAILSVAPAGRQLNFLLSRSVGGFRKDTSVAGVSRWGLEMIASLRQQGFRVDGSIVLEVGTGWHPTMPLLFSSLGAAQVFTYDITKHVTSQLALTTLTAFVRAFDEISRKAGVPVSRLEDWRRGLKLHAGVGELMRSARIAYIAPGDATRTGLGSCSVDLVFTRGVLEHVPVPVAQALVREAHRVLKPSGFMYHRIGLQDHYAGFDKSISMVNFLKYSDVVWGILGQNRIHYQNRLRCSQFLDTMSQAGFRILWKNPRVDEPSLRALRRMRVNDRYKGFLPEDLATHLLAVIAAKPNPVNAAGRGEP
jgi:SAM-dependent methyltransferase